MLINLFQVTYLSDITSDLTTFTERKFTLENWGKGEYDVDWNILYVDYANYAILHS